MKSTIRGVVSGFKLFRRFGVSAKERLKEVPSFEDFMKISSSEKAKGLEVSQNETLSGKKYFIETYGCQMNEADSEIVRSILEASGMTSTPLLVESDLVLLNTCAIRENAENKVFQRLNQIKADRKKEKADFMIGVLGCMAERLKEELVVKNKAVDMVVGPDAYRDLPRLISDLMVVFHLPSSWKRSPLR